MKELAKQRIKYLIEHGGVLPSQGESLRPLLFAVVVLLAGGDALLLVRCLQCAL